MFNHTHKLKGVMNSNGEAYYISPQLPEPLHTERIERESRYRSIKRLNALLSENKKDKQVDVRIKNKVLYVNKVLEKTYIYLPTVQDIFNLDNHTMEKINNIQLTHTDPMSDKGSVFRAHAFKVNNSESIKLAYKKLKLMYPESNHIMLAYAIKKYMGHQDDGEFGAGKRIQQILLSRGHNNTAVFVTREYGGFHLGKRRFLHIEAVTHDVLDKLFPV